ncbi:MAG: type III pantothenate kinase [Blastocatellia bacterium]
MILCLDVGNTQIFGGVFKDNRLVSTFRKSSTNVASSDEFGLFLRAVLRENGYDPSEAKQVAICSVVPNIVHSLRAGCLKYFGGEPFLLQPGVKTGLKINYRNPVEVGADRIANAIGAVHQFPDTNLIILDLGTASTFCAVSADRQYLGGAITAGLRISMEALESKTARLPAVEILKPATVIGRSTVECIQSGLFFGAAGSIREITGRMKAECFPGQAVKVIGTGGFSRLFDEEALFDHLVPDLVLHGLYHVWRMNS